ncbi:hypothetical protein VMCG_04500 [Cytospora schulzeri]|uniref:NmrA-like domain-containing protein n=1 Tax=Cytospora schulzeri TaxID=448051 RepID=A0A423WS47_9PEZI|nr:hypothetical protein VMCG_04500 [Valsa malicola]
MPAVLNKRLSRTDLQQTTTLEYTSIHNGMFLDFWGLPTVKSHMTPYTTVMDMEHDYAAIPGSGDVPVVFTHTSDVARYVAALLGLKSWDSNSVFTIIGDKVTWNQFLSMAESAKGQATILPGHASALEYLPQELLQKVNSAFGLWFARGAFNLEPNNVLNDEFPHIQPMKVKDILTASWKSP